MNCTVGHQSVIVYLWIAPWWPAAVWVKPHLLCVSRASFKRDWFSLLWLQMMLSAPNGNVHIRDSFWKVGGSFSLFTVCGLEVSKPSVGLVHLPGGDRATHQQDSYFPTGIRTSVSSESTCAKTSAQPELLSRQHRRLPVCLRLPAARLSGHFLSLSASSESQTYDFEPRSGNTHTHVFNGA